jgi:hypothetical protein
MQTIELKTTVLYTLSFSKNHQYDLTNLSTDIQTEGENSDDICYAILLAVNEDEDKYYLKITKSYVDKLKDITTKSVIHTNPAILQKLFSGEFKVKEIYKDNFLQCIIDTGLLTFKFILKKEQVDEKVVLYKRINKLEKRIKELENNYENLVYLEMPDWKTIQNDIANLYEKYDLDYQKFIKEQHNTTKDVIVTKYFSDMKIDKKYECWLTLIYNTQNRIMISCDAAKRNICGQGELENFINAQFKLTNVTKFRKFFINQLSNTILLLKTQIISSCDCAPHKYGKCGLIYLSYIDQ